MEADKKSIYDIILTVWSLWKKYGFNQKLSDEQWEQLINDGMEQEKMYKEDPYNLLFKDLFLIITHFYEGKYKNGKV